MSSVVIELQQDALNRNIQISDILRKTLVVARKLKIKEVEEWISNELNGYSDVKNIPKYRKIRGEIKGWNPFHGWQPIVFEDTEYAEKLSTRPCTQTIAEIESLINKSKGGSTFHIPFPKNIEKDIMEGIHDTIPVTLVTQETSLIRIIDTVRTIVLNWALKLEEDGILGENITFTTKEKSAVEKHSYNVNNFYGTVNSPQIQQQPDHSTQISNNIKNDIASIKSFIELLQENKSKLPISKETAEELNSEIETIEAQVKSPKPKRNTIKQGISTIREILEGAGGNIAAHLIIELGKLMFQ